MKLVLLTLPREAMGWGWEWGGTRMNAYKIRSLSSENFQAFTAGLREEWHVSEHNPDR